MLHLIIETSTERGLIAILKEEELIHYQELPFGHNNSKHIVPALAEAFNCCRMHSNQLTLVSVGIGPGSYTGIRIGVIVAKSLALAHHLPLVGLSSLEGYVYPDEGPFAAVIDAKIGGVYLLRGERIGKDIFYQGQAEVCTLDNVCDKLKGITQLVTPFASNLKKKFHQHFPENQWNWVESSPDPKRLGLIALEKYRKGEYDSEGDVEIQYLRKTQAEIEREV